MGLTAILLSTDGREITFTENHPTQGEQEEMKDRRGVDGNDGEAGVVVETATLQIRCPKSSVFLRLERMRRDDRVDRQWAVNVRKEIASPLQILPDDAMRNTFRVDLQQNKPGPSGNNRIGHPRNKLDRGEVNKSLLLKTWRHVIPVDRH